ncbi:MAG: hypothetical protein IT335_12995 [Thermomicrobiales bacterium]|nr:hypothetical protein [Thermomicrobiales bacterium]
MVWPFGRKNKSKPISRRDIDSFMRETFPDYDITERHRMAIDKFDRSDDGKLIKRHYELVGRIAGLPADRQAPVARDLVAIAQRASLAIQAKEQLIERQAKELKESYTARMPRHPGFERLAIDAEREARYSDAIDLCETARRQRWNGDWDRRIQRCKAAEKKHR